ncbi:MAG TPA: 3-hydroxybutyryl-CoA dehydrogenase [Dermatophilaceae bacterium]|nr:3-hydroxybutyryl-CoA dehydrogenase [Dermatophilaceae bacterium]
MARDFAKVGVVGLGTMGAGIAEVFARNGMTVVGVEADATSVERGKGIIRGSTDRAVARGKITAEEQADLLGRISASASIHEVADCDLVIEAIPEKIELKREVFANLDRIVGDDTVLATNTSSLSVTDIAVSTEHPKRVVGMHFFNPAPVMGLVEVISTVITEEGILEDIKALVVTLGKKPVVVGDKAGFIANALLMAYLNHAMSMYENRYASREDIDAAMKLGCGLPMGPLALVDLIGLDTTYAVLDTMYHEDRDRLHAPTPILKQMISAGLLGRKTGRGFYTYDKPGTSTVVTDALTPKPRGEGRHASERQITSVGVIGNGTMAMGIVEVFAKAGFPVTFVARSDEKAAASLAKMTKGLERTVERGRLTPEKRDAALALVTQSSNVADMADVDIVVEAIAEELTIKQDMFRRLDEVCKPGTILATTTSSLPVIQCAVATSRSQDVIGMHFFNPAQVMKLVEIVTTVATGADVTATVRDLCFDIGKHPVTCGDRSGFIVNALLFPYLNDAVKMLEAHYADVDDMDTAMKAGCGYPMGPFALLDVVGLDVSLAIQKELYMEFRERGFAPVPLLEHMVTAGYLGRKTGRGFRKY